MRRGIAGLAAISFLGFALLQLNDPDPVRWFAFYALGAVSMALEAAGRGDRRLHAVVAGIGSVWAVLWIATGQLGGEAMHYGPTWGPLAQEGMRELLGLSLVALTAGALAVRSESTAAAAG